MKKGKIISMALSLAMAVSVMPSPAVFAAGEPEYIWHAEFNGDDNTEGWSWLTDQNKIVEVTPSDGAAVLDNAGFSSRMPMLTFGTAGEGGTFTKSKLDISAYTDLVFETRFKMDNANGKISSIGKQLCGMIKDGNYHASIFQKDGFLAYGNGHKNSNNNAEVISDFTIEPGKWYTYTIHLLNNQKMTVEVTTEDGAMYIGSNEAKLPYGGAVQQIESFPFAYSGEVTTTVDYVRLYDNSVLAAPVITYDKDGENIDLNGAVDMKDSFTATINYDKAITADELTKINVNNNAEAVKTLSDDGKTVTLNISGLKPGTEYTVTSGTMAFNKFGNAVFTTKQMGIGVTYDNSDLNGAFIPPVDFEASLTFEAAVTEEEYANSVIAINNGATVTKGELSSDGKTAAILISGLNEREKYTLSFSGVGANTDKSVSFATKSAGTQWIYRAEFDGKDYDLSGFENVTYVNKDENGLMHAESVRGDYLKLNIPELKESQAKNIVYETKVKYNKGMKVNEFVTVDGKDALYSSKVFLELGTIRFFTDTAGNFAYANGSNSNTGDILKGDYKVLTDYKIFADTWYTFRIETNTEAKTVKIVITDENGNVFKSNDAKVYDNLRTDVINFGYLWEISVTADYLRIWDDDLLSKPSAVYNGKDLSLEKNAKEGTYAQVTVQGGITEADAEKITLNGSPAEFVLADNNTVNVRLNNIGNRQWNTLFVPSIGENREAEFVFRSADEGKYLYRAEFDGNDDDTPMRYNSGKEIYNNSDIISDGVLNLPQNNRIHMRFTDTGNPLNCEGMENVVAETRIKYGSGGNIAASGTIPITTDFAIIRIEDNIFKYNCAGSSAVSGENFVVYDKPFEVVRDEWYTFRFNVNYKTHTYTVTVSDEHGNVANSGVVNFLNNSKLNIINTWSYTWMSKDAVTAPVMVDYLRISNEDYGRAKITYSNGAELENAALIPLTGEQFKITCDEGVTANINGITLKDENGRDAEFYAEVNGNVITLTPEAFTYNTGYTLFVPKSATSALTDQTVSFRTVWNENAEFVYPAGFEKDKFTSDNKLNVVFFGGSITNQNGWRITTSDWFKSKYGAENVNAVNASVGGTGAMYGWVRINRDVISANPDIVFIEFATNDANNPNAGNHIESLVRTLKTLDKPPVIIFVYTTVINFADNNNSIAEQEKVAKHYGIPSINICDYMQSLYNNDAKFAADWNNKVYLADGTHPNQEASAMYGQYVNAMLESNSDKYFVYAKDAAALNADTKDYCYKYENVNHTLSGIGDSYSFRVMGDEFAVEFSKNASAGTVSVEIDGEIVNDSVNTYRVSGPDTQLRYENIGKGAHDVKITVVEPGSETVGGNNAVLHTIYRLSGDYIAFDMPVFSSSTVIPGELLNASVSYVADNEKDFVLAIALYDENGKLTAIHSAASTTDGSGSEKSFSTSVTPKDGDVMAKAFVWDGFNTMKPFAESNNIGF